MKKKELKNLAKQIVECEKIISSSDDKQVIHQAEDKIMKLTNKVTDFNDMILLDDLLLELLEKK